MKFRSHGGQVYLSQTLIEMNKLTHNSIYFTLSF